LRPSEEYESIFSFEYQKNSFLNLTTADYLIKKYPNVDFKKVKDLIPLTIFKDRNRFNFDIYLNYKTVSFIIAILIPFFLKDKVEYLQKLGISLESIYQNDSFFNDIIFILIFLISAISIILIIRFITYYQDKRFKKVIEEILDTCIILSQ